MTTSPIRALTDEEVALIHEASLRLLDGVGVDVCHDRVRDRLLAAGARPGGTNARVRLPAGMVAQALAACPREIVLGSVRGDTYRMAPGERFYSSCVVDPFLLSLDGSLRPPRLADCADNARLVDGLDVITMPYKMDVDYVDLEGQAALLQSNRAFMANMSKHYICAPHDREAARTWMEMSEIMAGASLAENRLVSALLSPTSPLTFDRQYLELLDLLLPYGILLILLPCPQSGATAPLALAGTVVGFNAENLAAITIAQTVWPGALLHYHHVAMSFHMRAALSSLGGPEKALLAVAGADLGCYYGLSSGCAGSATNSSVYDVQNGAETMAQLLLSVGSRANLITGIGSLGNGMATSAEQILFDCDLIAMASYLARGIRVDEERLGLAAFARVGPGADFLSDESTLRRLRTGEHFYEGSFQLAGGASQRTMVQALHERAQQMIERHRPAVPAARLSDLDRYLLAHGETPQ